MNKNQKRIVLYIFCIIILVVSGLYYFLKPIQIQHTFQSGISIKDNSIIDSNISIDFKGSISNTDFKLSKLTICKKLKGIITINEKQYSMEFVNFGSATGNLFWGALTELGSAPNSKPAYTGYITNDLSKIYLSQDYEKYNIVAPANTIEEYNEIHSILVNSK